MTGTGTIANAMIFRTSMHDAQIVEKLYVALLTIDFCAEVSG
jgi:hypothetical protein